MDNLLKTCLYDKHVALKAQMSPFAGYMMPIQYTSIIEEHEAVRNNVGMFDVSHMGEIYVSGPDAEKFVNYIFSNQVAGMPVGKVLYGFMLYPTGGVVDDLLVYRMQAENTFLLVINSGEVEVECINADGILIGVPRFVAGRTLGEDYVIVLKLVNDTLEVCFIDL